MAVKVYCFYARDDVKILESLKSHLAPLRRNGLIDFWSDQEISAGKEMKSEREKNLHDAQIILLLISPNFMGSEHWCGYEMGRALERHERGDARLIPIILQPIHWKLPPIDLLKALPKNEKPINDPSWGNQNQALVDVVQGLCEVIEEVNVKPPPVTLADILNLEPMEPLSIIASNNLDYSSASQLISAEIPVVSENIQYESYEYNSSYLWIAMLLLACIDMFLLFIGVFQPPHSFIPLIAIVLAAIISIYSLYQAFFARRCGWFIGMSLINPFVILGYYHFETANTDLRWVLLLLFLTLIPMLVILYTVITHAKTSPYPIASSTFQKSTLMLYSLGLTLFIVAHTIQWSPVDYLGYDCIGVGSFVYIAQYIRIK